MRLFASETHYTWEEQNAQPTSLRPQRGNNKQPVFSTDADRQRFLDLVEQHSEERDVRVTAYTLMSNHFHLVAVGDRQDAISHFMREVNGQYATYRNATQRTTGRVWQNRFLDDSHWETALRYVEMNPAGARTSARLAKTAEDYRWSSNRAHLGLETPPNGSTWTNSCAVGPRPPVGATAWPRSRGAKPPPSGAPPVTTRHWAPIRRVPPKPRTHLPKLPPPPAHWPATQGSNERSAAKPSGKPIDGRLNAEVDFVVLGNASDFNLLWWSTMAKQPQRSQLTFRQRPATEIGNFVRPGNGDHDEFRWTSLLCYQLLKQKSPRTG